MLCKTSGLVLRFVKYKESSVIVTILTSAFGLQSYIANSVRTSKSRIALYQPLTQLDLVVYHRPSAELHRIKEIKTAYQYRTIFNSPHKSGIVFFLSEVLNKTIREDGASPDLCDFLFQSLRRLDETARCENFHLSFLIHLSFHFGFRPYQTREMAGAEALSVLEDEALTQLLQGDFGARVTLTRPQRQNILDALLQFYAHHVERFGEIRSVQILRDLAGQNPLFNSGRKPAMFQVVYFIGYVFGGIVGLNRCFFLQNNFSFVVCFIHPMNGDACFFFPGGFHGFMYAVAVHSPAAVFWQQGRVNIDRLRKFPKQLRANKPKKSRQDNVRDFFLLQNIRQSFAVQFFVKRQRRDVVMLGSLQHIGRGIIRGNERDLNFFMIFKMTDNGFRIGSVSRSKYCQTFHAAKVRINRVNG